MSPCTKASPLSEALPGTKSKQRNQGRGRGVVAVGSPSHRRVAQRSCVTERVRVACRGVWRRRGSRCFQPRRAFLCPRRQRYGWRRPAGGGSSADPRSIALGSHQGQNLINASLSRGRGVGHWQGGAGPGALFPSSAWGPGGPSPGDPARRTGPRLRPASARPQLSSTARARARSGRTRWSETDRETIRKRLVEKCQKLLKNKNKHSKKKLV